VPPPATTAVPNAGLALEPCEMRGTPLVAEGVAVAIVAVPAPRRTLYWVRPVSCVVRVLPVPTMVMLPVPSVLTLPDDGEIAPPELPVSVAMWLSVCHVGKLEAPVLVSTWPTVPVPTTFWNAPVDVVPAMIIEYAVNAVLPVPPPATTAVPNAGLALEPCEMRGTPLVEEGATVAIVAVPAPRRTLYWRGR